MGAHQHTSRICCPSLSGELVERRRLVKDHRCSFKCRKKRRSITTEATARASEGQPSRFSLISVNSRYRPEIGQCRRHLGTLKIRRTPETGKCRLRPGTIKIRAARPGVGRGKLWRTGEAAGVGHLHPLSDRPHTWTLPVTTARLDIVKRGCKWHQNLTSQVKSRRVSSGTHLFEHSD